MPSMRLLSNLLGRSVQNGTLRRTDANGRVHVFGAERPGPTVAVPAAFGPPRQCGAGARWAAVGLALGPGYLVAAGLLGAVCEAGVLPPVLAAWTAPFLFAVAGVLL
jgi:hypothetical protein